MKSAERRANLLDCGRQNRQVKCWDKFPQAYQTHPVWAPRVSGERRRKTGSYWDKGRRLRCGRQCESNSSVINAESNQASNSPVISPKTRTMLQAVLHRFTNRTTSQFIGLQISQLHYLYKPPLLNLLPTVVKKTFPQLLGKDLLLQYLFLL